MENGKRGNTREYGKIFLIIFLFFSLFWALLTLRSSDYYLKGTKAIGSKDTLAAITYFERSALYFIKGNYYVRKSIRELQKIRDKRTAENQPFARQAASAIKRIERQLYPIKTPLIRKGVSATPPGGMPPTRRIAIHIFFLLWIGGAVWLFLKGFTPGGRVLRNQAAMAIYTYVVSLLAWLFLLAV